LKYNKNLNFTEGRKAYIGRQKKFDIFDIIAYPIEKNGIRWLIKVELKEDDSPAYREKQAVIKRVFNK